MCFTQQREEMWKVQCSFTKRDSTCFNSLTMATSCKGLMYWDNSSSSFSSRNSKNALILVQSCRGQKSFSRHWYRSCSCGIICCWTFIFSYKQEKKTASKILTKFSNSGHQMKYYCKCGSCSLASIDLNYMPQLRIYGILRHYTP